jgi:uncharacterized membrane protein
MTRTWLSITRALLLALALLSLATAAVTALAPDAEARSGSSAKGGSFSKKSSSSGSSSGSSSSSSRSSSSGSSSSRSSSYTPSRSTYRPSSGPTVYVGGGGARGGGGSFGDICCGLLCLAAAIGGFYGGWYLLQKRKGATSSSATTTTTTSSGVDITRLELGVQAQSRTQLQQHLDQLAQSAALDTEAGLSAFLQEILLSLQRNKESIDYAYLDIKKALAHEAAEASFQAWATEARGKYDREVIRRDELGTRQTQRNVQTESELVDEDGDLSVAEYFVVTLLVAKEGGPALPTKLQDTHDLGAVITAMQTITARQLMVVEVIWSPSAESDTMSRDDLSLHYPELSLL